MRADQLATPLDEIAERLGTSATLPIKWAFQSDAITPERVALIVETAPEPLV